LNVDDFPDSDYANELRRGLGRLRFDAPLEAEYTDTHLQRVRLHVRVWYSVTLVLACLFAIREVLAHGLWSDIAVLQVFAIFPCAAVLVWLAWSPKYQRLYLPVAQILVPIHVMFVALSCAAGAAKGDSAALAAFALNMFALFSFVGLLFRQALFGAMAMMAGFAAGAFLLNMDAELFVKCMVMGALSGVVSAIVNRNVEVALRRSFLENALIGELIARDPLTGLMNRRAFDEHLLQVWRHTLREKRSIALLMIDIDHFKRYNDTRGHQAGDLVLRSVANVIGEFARRPLDMAARFGGEEFVVILYDLSLAHVQLTADHLRKAVAGIRIGANQTDAPSGYGVTVSVGVGIALPAIGRNPEGAVQLADEALYEAKQAGRNCVIVKGAETYALLDTGSFSSPLYESRAATGGAH
jgi:diguanylate cyclase (GGDEF)-like protein